MAEAIVGDTPAEEEVENKVVETPAAEPTLEDSIRDTWDKMQSRDTEDKPEKEDKRKTREHAPDGKFMPKGEQVAAPEQTPEAPPVAEAQPDPVAAPVSVPPELQRLGLRKEEAEAIASNPVAMQAIIRRSEEMHRGLEQYRAKAQFGDEIGAVVGPHMDRINQMGITPAIAVRELLSVDYMLRNAPPQQKLQMLAKIANDYGIDMAQASQVPAATPYSDPQVFALKNELDQMRGWIQQQAQAKEQQESSSLNSELESFKADPANIHFETVRNDMAGLLQAGIATNLKEAYEKAIYANPTVRAQVLAKQQADAEAARKQEASQKALAAKQAASVNIRSRGNVTQARAVGSLEDTIRQEAERLGML